MPRCTSLGIDVGAVRRFEFLIRGVIDREEHISALCAGQREHCTCQTICGEERKTRAWDFREKEEENG